MRSRTMHVRFLLAAGLVGPLSGCHSILNEWLNPSIPGNFRENRTTSIRRALTAEDAPETIAGADDPTHEDLVAKPVSYRIGPGDILAIEIDEFRQVGVPWQQRFQVSEIGEIPLPLIGRMQVAGLTPVQIEDRLRQRLQEDEILSDPKVVVFPLDINEAKYMLFGVGVSASDNSPLRAGWFPILRPDLTVLEAINLAGGLNEFVTEIYIFRQVSRFDEADDSGDTGEPAAQEPAPSRGEGLTRPAVPESTAPEEPPAPKSSADELLEAVEPPEAPRPPVTENEEAGVDSPVPDTLYIYQDGKFVLNPARSGPPAPGSSSVPVERMPLYETIQSSVDWTRLSGETSYRVIRVPAEALRTCDPEYRVIVRPRDVIRIVTGEIGQYYVMGQVNRTGPFTFNAEQVTLKSAIAAAGGLGPLAWPSNCTIYRRHGLREQMIQVDLDAIFAGKEDDVVILRGDIINVGTSPFAPWLARLRALTLPNPTATVGYSFTYSRNFADIDSFAVQPNPVTRPKKFEQLFP